MNTTKNLTNRQLKQLQKRMARHIITRIAVRVVATFLALTLFMLAVAKFGKN